jgi:LysR family transcriptional activator of dmlA
VNNAPSLPDLRLFCVVVRLSSFVASANELGTSPAYVSKRIAILEKVLGAKLLHRSTRHVSMTVEGEAVYRWAREISDNVEQLTEAVSRTHSDPSGLLRVSTSFRLGRGHIGPVLSAFAKQHPSMEISITLVDRHVDMIGEGFDLDIRIGSVPEPHLIAHRIVASKRMLCAAPVYLEQRGYPQTLADLEHHACLVFRERDQTFGLWRFQGNSGLETVRVTGPISSNNNDVIRQCALDGHGIVRVADWDCAAHLASGELVRVLPQYHWPADVWAVTTSRLANSAKVRVCVEYLQEQLTSGPYALRIHEAA